MASKAIIFDFEDSFTYNIAEVLEILGIDCEVLHFSKILTQKIDNGIVIFGPGPGHPKEYQLYFSKIKKMLNNKNVFTVGICLGHQIIWSILTSLESIKQHRNITHGHNCTIHLPKWFYHKNSKLIKTKVVWYNSLYVKRIHKKGYHFSFQKNNTIMSQGPRLITYQFHPESIGTNDPNIFFQPLLKNKYFLK